MQWILVALMVASVGCAGGVPSNQLEQRWFHIAGLTADMLDTVPPRGRDLPREYLFAGVMHSLVNQLADEIRSLVKGGVASVPVDRAALLKLLSHSDMGRRLSRLAGDTKGGHVPSTKGYSCYDPPIPFHTNAALLYSEILIRASAALVNVQLRCRALDKFRVDSAEVIARCMVKTALGYASDNDARHIVAAMAAEEAVRADRFLCDTMLRVGVYP